METPTSSATALGASTASISELLNLPGSADLLDDADFESTMRMFDHTDSAGAHTTTAQRHSVEPLDFSISNLVDLFEHTDGREDVHVKVEPPSALTPPWLRANGRMSFTGLQQQQQYGDAAMKYEPGGAPELSPVMDSFLRETWEDIVDSSGARAARSSWKMLPSVHNVNNTPGTSSAARITPLPNGFARTADGAAAASKMPVATAKSTSGATRKKAGAAAAAPNVAAVAATGVSNSLAPKPTKSRRAKQCVADGCNRRAQSNNRCKTHGGGARCQMQGCDKSSQGGGLCRAHGGGKKCRVPGCTKGTQRLGLCYLHGGIRRCITEGCKKKDRGNGYCISHGGGRRCEVPDCERSVRKGNRCQTHQVCGNESPFQITRGQGLAFP